MVMGKDKLQMAKPADELLRNENPENNAAYEKPGQAMTENRAAIDAAENEGLTIAGEPLPFNTIPAAEVDSFIRARAYEIYEQKCREDGHAEQHWRQAQSEILRCR
jgi:hypothetical protein